MDSKLRRVVGLLAAEALLPACAAWADTAESAESPLLALLVSWLPLLAVLVFLLWYIRRSGALRFRSLQERSLQQMERTEAKSQELIEILRRIEIALHEPREEPPKPG